MPVLSHSFHLNSTKAEHHPLPPSSISSPHLQVPNVYVHPPEEEHWMTPPWCLFDANKARRQSSSGLPSDAFTLNTKFPDWQDTICPTADDAPAFQRSSFPENDIVMPRRAGLYHSRPESPPGILPEETEVDGSKLARARERERARDDEDVVEVVKLRKRDAMQDVAGAPAGATKKTKSALKSRASMALRSIKNVGRGSRKAPVPEVPFPKAIVEKVPVEEFPQATRTRKLSRRMSRPLSQIFGASPSPRPEPDPRDISETYEDISSSTPVDDFSPAPSRSSSILRGSFTPASSAKTLHPSPQVDEDSRPVTPSTSSESTARRRFSLMNLQHLFTSPSQTESSQTEAPQSSASSETTESFPSTTEPTTPDFDVYSLDDETDGDMQMDEREEGKPNAGTAGEISFEMRLDSLHFDSLSFDPDVFDVGR